MRKINFERKAGKTALVVCLLVTALLLAPHAEAAVLYVEAGVDPGGDGSSATPYATIQSAIEGALALDAIYVRPGNYQEDVTVGKGIKLIGEDPETTIVQATGNGFRVTGEFLSGETVVEIAGFTITNGSNGVYVDSSTAVVYFHNNIVSYNGNGIYAGVSCKIIASNNVFAHNTAYALRIADNYFPTFKVYNNIFLDNYALYTAGTEGTYVCFNNNFNFQARETGSYQTNDDIDIDPLFVNEQTGNYRLSAASPSIDAGRKTAVDNDPDGTRNDQGVYGGPGAAGFWPGSAGGPVVTEFSVTPSSVAADGTITIQAKGVVP